MGKIFLSRLKLAHFRNYQTASLDLTDRHVVLTGANGAGKTNILEAISFLSPGRGMRRAAYSDVPSKSGDGSFSVFSEVSGLSGEVQIGTGLTAQDTGMRRVRINGTPSKTNDELLDHLRVLWLTPAMDGLFTGGAGDRRRFLDRLVLSIDPLHGKRSIAFEKAMRSRNKLLAEGKMDPVWLDGIEAQMAELGIAIAAARSEVVTLMANLIENNTDETVFPKAQMSLDGFDVLHFGQASVDQEQGYGDMLAQSRFKDAAAGRTLAGPHRADLNVFHHTKQMPAAHCSTGEQKALLIGLILAHARLVSNISGAAPILLLDEIAAHLDPNRRAALFDLIDDLDCQSFMTGTDRHMFDAMGKRAQYFDVADGQIATGQEHVD